MTKKQRFISKKTANGNYGTSYISQEDADKQAITMDESGCINCYNCVDCINCTGCVNCINCRHCTRCTECTDCTDCVACMMCNECYNCVFCKRCSMQENKTHLTNQIKEKKYVL